MKNISTFLFFSLLAVIFFSRQVTLNAQGTMKQDSIVMSAAYANEVYYSMKNGIVMIGSRNTWDIAFRTMKRSSSILTNDGAGVVLYTYPKSDTTGWNTMDTVGLSTWKPMYNDPNDWENGAFSRNARGHPDYGWCKYNDVTHNLVGDSLFVIKVRDGSFKKLWIVKKYSSADIYLFRYANLDGSSPNEVLLNLSTMNQDFFGYSIQTNEPINFEPTKFLWDIVFTKYVSVQSDGSPYPVVGVLSNDSVKVKHFHPVSPTYSDFGAGTWDSTRSPIGWNWKKFDMGSYTYLVPDSNDYFVKPVQGDIYKLYFTAFNSGTAANSPGLVKFSLGKVAGAGFTALNNNDIQLSVFPNPASNRIHINMTGYTGEDLTFTLTDLSGRQLRADRPRRMTDGFNAYSMDVAGVQPGIYFVTVSNAAMKTVAKVIISR